MQFSMKTIQLPDSCEHAWFGKGRCLCLLWLSLVVCCLVLLFVKPLGGIPYLPASSLSNEDRSIKSEDSDYIWVPVSKVQQLSWNASNNVPPFHHCTLGGCRRVIDGILETPSVFLEPILKDHPVYGLSNILDIIHASKVEKGKVDRVCTLWFVGDSTSSDTALAAACELLSNMEYKMDRCNSLSLGGVWYGEDKNYCSNRNMTDPSFEGKMSEQVSYFDMSRVTSQGVCSRVRIKYTSPESPKGKSESIQESLEKSALDDEHGIAVLSWGVHCSDVKCMKDNMSDRFRPALAALPPDDYVYLWREHEPQHFAKNAGAIYVPGAGNKNKECGPPRNGHYNNYRNEIAETYLQSEGLLGKGDQQVRGIVRIYDALKSQWELHRNGTGDCTHYCFSPWRFKLTWHGIHQAMTGF